MPLGTSVLPTQRPHHSTEFPKMLPTAPLFLSPSPFFFLDSPSSSLGATPLHPYFLTLYYSQCHCAHLVLLPALFALPEDHSGAEAGRRNRCSFYHWAWAVVGWEEGPWQLTIFIEFVYFLHPGAAAGWTSTFLDVGESRNAVNARQSVFLFQTPDIIGLGPVPQSPLQTRWPYRGEPLGRCIALPPSLFSWILHLPASQSCCLQHCTQSTV